MIVIPQPQGLGWFGQVEAVVLRAGDVHGFAKLAGAVGQTVEICGSKEGMAANYASIFCHHAGSRHRLDGAEKNSTGFAVWQAGNIQAVVISINEIYISVARRAEDHLVPWRAPGGGMGGGVILAEVGFCLHDASGKNLAALATDHELPQQIAGDPARVAVEKLRRQGLGLGARGYRGHSFGAEFLVWWMRLISGFKEELMFRKALQFTTLFALLGLASAQSIPAGTRITVRSGTQISSASAKAGEAWNGVLAKDLVVGSKTLAKKGAPVSGTVTLAKSSGRLHAPGQLTIRLTSVDVGGKSVAVRSAGYHIAGKDQTKSSAMKGGGGLAAGAIIGAIAGGGKGAAIGALAGGAAGTGLAAATGKREAVIPAESAITFTTVASK